MDFASFFIYHVSTTISKKTPRNTSPSLSLETFNTRLELVKGKLRATLIQRFDGSTALIGLKSEGVEFSVRATLQEAHAEAEKLCRAITIEHLHG